MAKYNYFQCQTCAAGKNDIPKKGKFRIAVLQPPVPVVAARRCEKCNRFMTHIGSGNAPFAPSSVDPDLTIPVLADAETVVHQGNGVDSTGRSVDYTVHENQARARFRISLRVNNGGEVIASLTTRQVRKQGLPRDWIVLPPFAPAGDVWATLNTEAMSNLRTMVHSDPANKLPSPFAIRMTMGNHAYGLIHLLAGHHQNTRTWIGTNNPSRMTEPDTKDAAELAKYAREKEEEEGYRSIQGIQRAIEDAVAPKAIQRVIRSGDKYILYGSSANRHAKIVVMRNGGAFTMTTMYIHPNSNQFAAPRAGEHDVWVRPPGR